MLIQLARSAMSALAIAAAGHAALAQELGPPQRQAILDEVAAMNAAERADILTDVIPAVVATLAGQMPSRINETTTATGIVYLPPVIVFTYQTEASVGFGADVMAERRATLVQAICGQDDMFFYLALEVAFRFVYRVGKAEMAAIDLALADCDAGPVPAVK
ncbi:MAG: hypothetical protein ACWA6X_08325 [Bauldia sp.]